jgi:GNAT superfamily N-acetyltransferase
MYIGLAENKDSSLILELLNEITLKLLTNKVLQWDYPWDNNVIDCDISGGYQYIVKEENKIIAVFSLKDIPVNFWSKEISKNQMYFYRVAVVPAYQGKNIGKYICNWVQSYAKKNNKHIFLDCWAGNSKLHCTA